MISREDIESFLIRTEMPHEEIGDEMWLVDPYAGREDADTGGPVVVVSLSPPLVILRSSLGAAPEGDDERLRVFQNLLELNATDLVHGAYGLENGEVVLSDALELENLDYSEFLASLESLTMALTSHREQLAGD
ncbi:MAG: hypothetical protein ACE5HF_08735 [Gemmatimonadota bacterium]